jgi:hypothetical protein
MTLIASRNRNGVAYMKIRCLMIVCFFIYLSTVSCAGDPLLNPDRKSEANYSYKDIKITNHSSYAVGVCEFSDCDFNVPAGQTQAVPVRYFNYDKSKPPEYLRITIQTAANRQVATLKEMSLTPFITEGTEVKWMGNFSGPHSFIVTSELAARAADLFKDDEDYSDEIDSDLKFSSLLNLLDSNLTLKSEIFRDFIEVTLPENDSEVFWGQGATTDPDGATVDGGIVVNHWRYERMSKVADKVLFSEYTKHVSFVCNDGGCFPEI